MTPTIPWEAAVCTACNAGSVHKLVAGPPSYMDGGLCPACDKPALRVIHNQSVILSMVLHITSPPTLVTP